ncbi:low molecular weight protein-tyrosine-phosphatase [Acidihalobacter ferrooxydans]|uniref:protein-tyrosine-phosphatase n=1 Tax=Acidihalobacter ferrooxydans TaxID=1765967 RepID=A0A1P8UEZ3_9GAMM|nr:low molecular weight protein-tyrosine-phosphatase [Acidihalobacter ferrooxydans]APZ42334.1 phosphotyrosine protein phosphatase [Acidihalobacter ferrooxydans]
MKVKVLFVCMGNICRSPAAQGVFERLVSEQGLQDLIEADSAGTHAYHVGEAPDARMQEAARRRGYDLRAQRARRVTDEDFQRFDYVLAMDRTNLAALQEYASASGGTAPELFLRYAHGLGAEEVPDPYYGGTAGFERVLDLVEEAAAGLLRDIQTRRLTAR